MIGSFFENLRLSLIEIRTNKLRAFLTMLGIMIGIAAVVILLSLGQAVQDSITSQFESLGANVIRISATVGSDRTIQQLTMKEVEALSDPERVAGVMAVMPMSSSNFAVVYGSNEYSVSTQGVTTDYSLVQDQAVEKGTFFTEEQLNTNAQVAIIGSTTAENLFETVDPLGKSMRVGSVVFQVIGVLEETGTSDNVVLVPITTYRSRLRTTLTSTGEIAVSSILVRAADNDAVSDVVTAVTRVLREERGVGTGDTDNFRVFTASTILDSLTTVVQVFTLFLGVVAGISLLVGGIGVMNIMLVTVTERTQEIGLRKAIGAQNVDIIYLFLLQAVVITLMGGVVGVALAFAGAAIITNLVGTITVVIQTSSIIMAVSIAAGIGIFFGVYPASRAARLNPIDALRYE
ncbi:MAG: ABC transporter permease [Anaerolineae bacterium]|nr:ABC transporter permease [Anaerolineae bacterium]MBN8620123.1 ABC transporter permease [Anaerolineae bacterium]